MSLIGMCTHAVPKSIKLDDLERKHSRFRITISSEMAIFSHFTQKHVAVDTLYTATDTIYHQ